ncbi:MAG: hypothetical protein E4H11_03685 [Myxococcales bacterium]|nr:MAG: hypothetical protein E4H11_03685 [Myxococcales bacterium]
MCYLPAVIRYRRRRLEPFAQRLKRLRARVRGGLAKQQTVHLVQIGDLRAKRVAFAHASQAASVEHALETLRECGIAPQPIARYANELWVEFVEGTPLDSSAPPPVEGLARVFQHLYRTDVGELAREDRDFAREVLRDLHVLRVAGVIDQETCARLERRAETWCPARVFTGCDYVDARPGNFLRTAEGRLRIIDVESLVSGELIGTGAARAWLRWPGLEREGLLAALGVPRFADYADFLELRFAARWTKRCLLQRKLQLIEPGLLRGLATLE